MRKPQLRLSLSARPVSLLAAALTLALTGVLTSTPVQALEPGPGVASGLLLPLNPSGPPASMELRSITPDYVSYTEPGPANPFEVESFSVRRVSDGSLVTTLPSNMPTDNQPSVSGNSVVQVSPDGTKVTSAPVLTDPKGRTWTVQVPTGGNVLAATQEGVVAIEAPGATGTSAVMLLRQGQPDLVLPMRMAFGNSGNRLAWTGDGRTLVMSGGSQLWALDLVTGDARLLASKDSTSFDRIRISGNRVFWVDTEWVPTWQDRVSWVGLDGSAGGDVVVADPGYGGYIGFGDGLAILHVPAGRSASQADLEPLDLTTGARQPAVASFVTAAYGVGGGRAVLVTGDTPDGRIVEVGADGATPRTIVDLPVNPRLMSLVRLNGERVDADFGDPYNWTGPIANIATDGTGPTWSTDPRPGLPAIEGGLADVRGDTWLTVLPRDSVHYWTNTYRLSWPGGHRDLDRYSVALGRGGQLYASGQVVNGSSIVSVYDVRTGTKLATVPAPKTMALDGTTIWQSPDATGTMTGTDATGVRPLRVVNTGLIGCSLMDGQVAGRWALVSCQDAKVWAVDLSGVLVPWNLPSIAAKHWNLSLGNGFVTWAQLVRDGAGQQYMQAAVLDLGPGHTQRLYGPLHGNYGPPDPAVAPDDAGATRMVYLDAYRQARVVDLDWLTPAPTTAAPAIPARPTAAAGDARAQVSWVAPHDGGSAITGYTVTAAPGGRTATTTGTTTATVSGLANGTAYTFTVTATNDFGTSPGSVPSAAITPKAPLPMSPLDFTGDGKADLHAVKGNGDLYLYRGNGLGGFTGAGTKIGTGWSIFTKVLSPGDFTGDRKADLIATKTNGDLYLYRGNGLGGFTGAGTKIGTGWSIFTKVL